MPGSEADSGWWFVSYPGEHELPSAGRFSKLAGCDSPEGGVSRQDFDATLDQLGDVQPWMDRSQKKSARGFARLQKLFHRRYDELAIYRCETDTRRGPHLLRGRHRRARGRPHLRRAQGSTRRNDPNEDLKPLQGPQGFRGDRPAAGDATDQRQGQKGDRGHGRKAGGEVVRGVSAFFRLVRLIRVLATLREGLKRG